MPTHRARVVLQEEEPQRLRYPLLTGPLPEPDEAVSGSWGVVAGASGKTPRVAPPRVAPPLMHGRELRLQSPAHGIGF